MKKTYKEVKKTHLFHGLRKTILTRIIQAHVHQKTASTPQYHEQFLVRVTVKKKTELHLDR